MIEYTTIYARELVNKFLLAYDNEQIAIKSALIAVDEILDAVTTIADKKYEFYQQVKQEINAL